MRGRSHKRPRTAATIVAIIGCAVLTDCCHARFPEDDHQISLTKVVPPQSPADREQKVGIKGSLDSVKGQASIGGTLIIRGWAGDEFTGGPVDKVNVTIDDLQNIDATIGGDPRPDVVNAFNHPNWLNSGWIAKIVLDHMLPGEHKIAAVATSSDRSRVLDGAQCVEVTSTH